MGEELLQEAFVQRHPEWIKELQIMLKSGEKAEIQVGSLNIFFLTFTCLVLTLKASLIFWRQQMSLKLNTIYTVISSLCSKSVDFNISSLDN